MDITIVIPHYKTGKMTAYAISQFLKHTGKHNVKIIIVDNSYPDNSIQYITKTSLAASNVLVVHNEGAPMQSHGIALNFAMQYITTDYFITAETDSFPTNGNWLDEYENRISDGYEIAGSELQLSGGRYIHPAGCLYKKSNWEQAKAFCDQIPYLYLPNAVAGEDFKYHLMVHTAVYDDLVANPEKWKIKFNYSGEELERQRSQYLSVCAPFHEGRGNRMESLATYGQRTIESDSSYIINRNTVPFIRRIGYEPGQWFSYWHQAIGKKLGRISTKIVWLPNRENQQQEYTLMINGFKHLWGVTAYSNVYDEHLQDIANMKRNIVDVLFSEIEMEDVRSFTLE